MYSLHLSHFRDLHVLIVLLLILMRCEAKGDNYEITIVVSRAP